MFARVDLCYKLNVQTYDFLTRVGLSRSFKHHNIFQKGAESYTIIVSHKNISLHTECWIAFKAKTKSQLRAE